MKITIKSAFHDNLSVSFSGCKVGYNVRKLKGKRSNYCLDYSNSNSHVCGCGFPCSNVKFEMGEGNWINGIGECGENGEIGGRGFIMFELREKDENGNLA